MKNDHDIENVLAQTALTSVVPGSHRRRLKQELFEQMQTKEKRMPVRRFVFATRGMKIAAACAGTLLLVAGAWGAQGVFEVLNRFVFHEEPVTKTVTRPDGTETALSSSSSFTVSSDDPNFTEEDARQRHEGIKQAIADGKAELVETKQTELGTTAYIYKATLEDGQEVTWADGRRLYDPNQAELDAEFEQAVADGLGEVVKVVETDACTVYIRKVILSDGSDRTYGSNVAPAEESP